MIPSHPSRHRLLPSGAALPCLGLGVYQARPGEETYRSVRLALDAGYRHIDTAAVYGNESDVGQALRDSGIPRESVCITTKLWNADQGYPYALRACETSLRNLGIEVLDLYLIHWPQPGTRLESWRALLDLQRAGKVRDIGVSNYEPHHLEELHQAFGVWPAVNQFECSVFLQQRELRACCARQGIVAEAYSPLARGRRMNDLRLTALASRLEATPAQVMLAWAWARDLVVLPKSVHGTRVVENAAAQHLTLSQADLELLDGLEERFRTCWDPTGVP